MSDERDRLRDQGTDFAVRPPSPWATPPQFESVPGRASPSGPHGFGGALPATPGGAPRSAVISVPPVSIAKPPFGIDWRGDGTLAAASNANTPAIVAGASYDVQVGNVGYLRSLVLQVNTLLATSLISWSVTVDNVPVVGWNNIQTLPGNIAVWVAAFGPDETFLEVQGGKTIAVTVTVDPLDAGVYQLGAQFHGWSVSQAVAAAYAAAWGG